MTSPVLQATTVDEAIASPRSTVLSNPKETAVKTKDFMTTDVGVGGMNNDTNVPDAATAADAKVTSSKETSDAIDANGSAPEGKGPPNSKEVQDKQEDENREFAPTPVPQAGPGFPGYPSHLTPQPMSGYYQGYGGNLQVTPEPPSPGGGGHPIANAGVYDTGSFFQQHGAFAPSHTSPFGGPNVQQLSPPRGATNMVGSIPPASPLFPRVNSANGHGPPSPNNLPYMSPPLGSSMYQQSYPVVNHANSGSSNSPDEANAWGDRYVASFSLCWRVCLYRFRLILFAHCCIFNIVLTSLQKPAKRVPAKLAADERVRYAHDSRWVGRQSVLV